MANTRISDLTASASNLASTDLAPVVQTVGVGPVKMTGAQIAAGLLSATTPIGSGPILSCGGSATLQLGAADAAAPVAQTLLIQSGSGTDINGVAFNIGGSKSTGTGTAGLVNIQTSSRGAASGTSQNVLATVASFGPNTLSGSQAISLLDMAQTWNTSGTPTAIKLNVTDTASNAASLLLDLQVGGVSKFSVKKDGFTSASAGILTGQIISSAGGIVAVTDNNTYFRVNTSLSIGSNDTSLWRDASNTLALRNGTSAQKFRVYNTYTSSTNYENFEIDWQTTANIALVGPTKGSGGGTQRVQRLQYLEDGGTGSTTPSLGTTCPAASATIKSWIKVITSDGTTAYIPCWA